MTVAVAQGAYKAGNPVLIERCCLVEKRMLRRTRRIEQKDIQERLTPSKRAFTLTV